MINLANKLTLSRIGLAFLFMLFLFTDRLYTKYLALFLFTAAVLTDFYDGRVARRRNTVTKFGKLMDPIADKILIAVALVSFLLLKIPIPIWMVVVILTREFVVTLFRLRAISKGKILAAEKGGKHKTFFQMAVVLTILLFICLRKTATQFFHFWTGSTDQWFQLCLLSLMLITVILTSVSGSLYLYRNRHLIKIKN